MATGLEQGLVLIARIASGSVFLAVFGLGAYGVGGYLFLVETIELAYPFLHIDRDPVLNLILAIIGVGMFVTSLPLLLLATLFNQQGIDVTQTLLTTALGAIGLALIRVSIYKVI